VQEAVPFTAPHTVPHVPQLLRFVCVLVSHPFAVSPSQFAQPALHDWIRHTPVAQVATAFGSAQGTPHPPQSVSVFRLVSQPLPALPSQLPVPEGHAVHWHTPEVQLGVPVGHTQTLPQVPQLLTFVRLSVSHPFAGLPSQSPHPVVHVGTHSPDTHEVPPWAFTQLTPQAPQLVVEVIAVSQPLLPLPSQSANPGEQAGTHTPATQEVVPLALRHLAPHAPQWFTSVCVLVSHPLLALLSQLANPALHCGLHAPDTQAVVPFGFEQAAPQLPQLLVVASEASHPLVTLLSQLPNPALHTIAQLPRVHDGVPLALLHAAPQAPQWLVLVLVLVSQPLAALLSQLPNPALQDTSAQVPVPHVAVAFDRLQVAPHEPQSDRVVTTVSQPLLVLPSQFPQPLVHSPMLQTPPKHSAAAFVKLHALAQRPQFCTSAVRFVSHPLAALPSQLPQPASQAIVQVPALQDGVPLVAVQVVPHVPQFATVVLRSVSQPLLVSLSQLPQPATQAPKVQTPVPQEAEALGNEHGTAHPPQFASVLSPVSHPLLALESQLPNPAAHTGKHTPAGQLVVPLALLHVLPHEPQSVTVFSGVSHPFDAAPSQLPNPALHVIAQTPEVHEGVPWLELHCFPHMPQLATVFSRLISQPLAASPSQSAYPALHTMPHNPAAQDGVALG
jgi:hypothetical protein